MTTLVCVVALAGCTSAASTSSSTHAATQGALVGTWTVEHTFDTAEQPFVAFVQDHSWIASDGCNRVYGSWKLSSGGRLVVTTGPHVDLTCAGEALPLAVTHGSTVAIDGKQLTIRSSDDATSTTLTRSTDSKVGPQGRPIGYWVAGTTPTSPYLSVQADGDYRLYDGCTVRAGTWVFSNTEELRLRPAEPNAPVCTTDTQRIGSAVSGTASGTAMTLRATGGAVVGHLTSR
jgi:hypothetical protein